MAMIKRGSQLREPIEDTEFVFLRMDGKHHRVVRSTEDRHYELWAENDGFAGYVMIISGVGHEFVRSLSEPEVLAMP